MSHLPCLRACCACHAGIAPPGTVGHLGGGQVQAEEGGQGDQELYGIR